MTHTSGTYPLKGITDLLAELALSRMGVPIPKPEPVHDPLDILPSQCGQVPVFPIISGAASFQPRWHDFVFGSRSTGDLVSPSGHRIYTAMFDDRWVLVNADKRRIGIFRSLRAAIARADRDA